MNNVLFSSKRIESLAPTAAGSTVVTGSVVDMQAFDSVVFGVRLGTLTSGQTKGTIQVFAGNDANGSDAALLAGASITVADGDEGKWEYIEVVKPVGFRYVQLVFTRNAQAAQVIATTTELFFSHRMPTSDDVTTVAQSMVVVDPMYADETLIIATKTYPSSSTVLVTTTRTP